ncbi:MAG: hypothetical protein HC803_00230 [Saprospiraceae bacterium]|nr:hypothetical protein [Saprospiraceae bacterium]
MKTQRLLIVLILAITCISITCDTQHAVAGNIRMNVLYIGFDNPIEIAVAEYPVEAISVKVSNGTITGSNGK